MNRIAYPVLASLLAMLVMVTSVGCGAPRPAPSGFDLSQTLVPNLDLDAYVYFKQANPTVIPGRLIGAPVDINMESLAVWGIARDDGFTFAGALTLTTAADAARIGAMIPLAGIWATVSDRTIYFVPGSGDIADKLKNAISKKDFKYYNDQGALAELAQFPNSGTTRLAAIAIVKPSKPLVQLIENNTDRQTASMVDSLMTWTRLQLITVGFYAPTQIDVADMAQRLRSGTIWDSDLGVLSSMKLGIPGFLVGTMAGRFLADAGYTLVQVGGLDVYQGSLKAGGRAIPVLLNLDGSHIFAAAGKASYAQTLITSVRR